MLGSGPRRQHRPSARQGGRVGDAGEICSLIAIDDFVRSNPPPTSIKLDIEGAEMQTLLGAEQTIRTHRPKFMVAVYHQQVEQFPDIMDWLVELKLGYNFWLGHHSPLSYETILYAAASEVEADP